MLLNETFQPCWDITAILRDPVSDFVCDIVTRRVTILPQC